MAEPVFLSLGTNVGDRPRNLARALAELGRCVTLTAVSSIYETAAWGKTDQADFLNLCVAATTTLPPAALLTCTQALERELGRVPGERWGPRLIDIDILYYGRAVIDRPQLTVPHRHLHDRAFVLVPLAEIAADWTDPRDGRTVQALADAVDAAGVRRVAPPPVPAPESHGA